MLVTSLVGVLLLGLTVVPNVHSLDCISCSSDNLAACATLLPSVELPTITCDEGVVSCYTYIEGETTVRGCQLPVSNPPTEYSSCSGDNCNINIYPENRIKCHKCSGESCRQSIGLSDAIPCQNYKADDQCFTYVFEDVINRGCLSENVEIICDNEINCYKCTDDSCNGKSIETETCIFCDSELDSNCVSNVNETFAQICPVSPIGMGCYRLDDGGDIVRRGCLSSLTQYEIDDCRREGQFCKTCTGNNCNVKADFETCRSCSSITDVNCIRSPDSIPEVTCLDYLDSCFTHVENNVVTRGCLAEQSEVIRTQCAPTTNDICEKCTGTSNCNNKIIDDEFCMECDSQIDPGCRTSLNSTMRTQCNLAVRPQGCYLFDDGGDIIKRGCINNDLHPGEISMCRQQGTFCKTCYGNDCNTKLTFQRCRSCNSATSVNCIRSGDSAAEITCRDYMDTCYVHVVNDTVTRGCVSQPNTPPAVQTECRRTNSDLCETCTANHCNGFLIDGEFCLTCDSQVDANCVDTLNHTMRTQCNLGVRRLGCYRFDDGGDIIKRGCLSHLIPEEIAYCRNQGQFCKTCMGDDCNSRILFQQCKSCNSTQNVDCIRSPGNTNTITCRNYVDECFVHSRNNQIARGCLQQNPSLENDCRNRDICESCDDRGNCNDRIVDGEFCITCDSQLDPNCINNLNNTMRTQCSLSVNPMGCYLFDDGGSIVKRGCLSDLIPYEVSMCRQEGQFCKTCIGNDCNTKVSFQRCRSCNSTTNVSCIRSGGSVAELTCRDYMDTCYVHVRNDIVTRGCVSQPTTPTAVQTECRRTNSDFCETCPGNNCNSLLIDGEFCLTCDSQVDANCVDTLNHTMRTQCNLGVRRLGCYRFDDGGDIIKRGCLSHLIPEEIAYCRNQGQFCKTCMGDDCNSRILFQQCKSCNSTQNVDCIRSPGNTNTITCRNYVDECFVHSRNNQIARGCLQQNPSLENDCRNRDICESCDDRGNCNDRIVDGEFCITCDSQLDPNCINNLNNTMRTQCSLSVNPMGCYLFDDGGSIVKRGCLSDLIPYEVSMCRQEGQFCKTCIGNDCNTKVSFQRCRSCNSTTNVSCIRSGGSVAELTCRDYMDTCYVHVRNDIVTRGCVSQPTTPTAVQTECRRTNSDFCETCPGNNCNSLLIDGEFCLTCDSQVDANCVDTLNHTMRTQCNLGVRRLGCYRFDDGGDIIKRGCLSHLIPEEIAYCRNQGQFCKTCFGDDCNAKIDFQECKICNSTQNVDCIRSAHYINSQVCRNYLDECFVHVQNNVILRGCLQQNPSFASDCRNPDICDACDERGNCNDQIVDGEFCITCDSQLDPNCIDNVNVTMRTQCNLAVTRLGCYLFNDGGSIVKRGCLSDLLAYEVAECRREGTFCKTCMGNDCNRQLEFQRCLTCDSMTSENCLQPNELVSSSLCRSYLDTCITHFQNNRVIRACSLQRNDLHLECAANATICSICDGPDCNNQLIEHEFCVFCDSEVDANCRISPNTTMVKQCGDIKLNKNGCYRFDDSGDIVKRGCLEDLLPEEIQLCRREQNECKTCIGNNCNLKAEFQSCYACNSENDSNCLILRNATTSRMCRNYMDECKTVAIIGGHTERGCSSELTVTDEAVTDECAAINCNSNVFPPNRLFCHQCSGVECGSNLSGSTTFSDICKNFNSNDQCFSFVDERGEMHRGCTSDKTDNRNTCSELNERCGLCSGTGCNTDPAVTQSTLSCIQCNNSEEKCAWGHRTSAASRCTSNVVFPSKESCYTYTYGDDTVTRGCTVDNQLLCSSNGQRCATCDSDGCNVVNVVKQSCKVCRSDVTGQEGCVLQDVTGFDQDCGPVVEYENRGCYSRKEPDDTIIRGCAVSLTPDEITECADEENTQCIYCSGNNCNLHVINHAAALKSIFSLIGTIIIVKMVIW